jgi:hypothetical protein
MITKQKIEIYKKFHGDSDGFVRVGSKAEKELMAYDDWALIDSVLQDLELIEKGLASEDFKNQIDSKLKENFDFESIEIIRHLR